MNIIVTQDYDDLSYKAARHAAIFINNNPGALICFAAGDTPLGTFRELVVMHDRGEVDLSSVYYVGLDEWVGLGIDDAGSCIKVMHDAIYDFVPKENVLMFDGLDPDTEGQCRKTEAWIEKHSGIGYTLLGIGMNGHIGFNEPGTPDVEGCFTVVLDDTTKSVSKKYFGKERPVTTGITIGWRTLYNTREAVLMANGKEKAPIAASALTGPCTPDIPASLFQNHPNLTVLLDKDAASLVDAKS